MERLRDIGSERACTSDGIVLGRGSHGDRLIFVGGPPRSGTTLVQNILDMHPEIIGAPEFLNFPDILRMRRAMAVNIERGWLDEYCSHEEFEHHLRRFVEALFEKLTLRSTRYISEKTPQNVIYFAELAELFPGARFINVVRDPRAIVASLLQVYQRAVEKGVTVYPEYTRNVHKAIAYTRHCLRKGWEFASANSDDVYTLKYENLILDPETETRRLCKYLDIPWSSELLHPGSKKHLGELAITRNSGEIWYDKQSYYRNPDQENLNKWRGTLSSADALLTARAFDDFPPLKSLGYDLDDQAFSVRDELTARAKERWHRLIRSMQRRVRAA